MWLVKLLLGCRLVIAIALASAAIATPAPYLPPRPAVCVAAPASGPSGSEESAPRRIALVAGVLGFQGTEGDGGPATSARLRAPTGIALDPSARRLYLADTDNHVVRAVDLDSDGGGIVTVAGTLGFHGSSEHGLPGREEQLHSPRDVVVDSVAGQLYVADTDNHVIRAVHLHSGKLQVVAGVFGFAGHRGDGGPATSAELFAPRAITVDAVAQRVYVADTGNHAVRLLDLTAGGRLSTIAGIPGLGGPSKENGPATSSRLHFPYGIAVDPVAQQLYVSLAYDHVVRSVDLVSGTLRPLAGLLGSPGHSGDEGHATMAQLDFPYGLSLDHVTRRLYIADSQNHVIRCVDLVSGIITTIAGVAGFWGRNGEGYAASALLHLPTGVAVDPATQLLYVVDRQNHAARVVDLAAYALFTGVGVLGSHGFTGIDGPATTTKLHHPQATAVDPTAQLLYVADTTNRVVRAIDIVAGTSSVVAGTPLSAGCSMSQGPAALALLDSPCGLAVDHTVGKVYIADAGAHVVRVVDSVNTSFETLAGVPCVAGTSDLESSQASSVKLHSPHGVAVDATSQQLYIADTGNHAVRVVNLSSGIIATVAGTPGSLGRTGDGGPATSARLYYPYDIAVDVTSQHLYVTDSYNHVARRIDLQDGIISTVAGVLGAGGHKGDRGPATAAELHFPRGIAVDPLARRVYIADTWNHAVRLLDLATGLIRTVAGVLGGAYGCTGDGGRALWAQLDYPTGIAVDTQARQLYVADASNHAVRRLPLSSICTAVSTPSIAVRASSAAATITVRWTVVDGCPAMRYHIFLDVDADGIADQEVYTKTLSVSSEPNVLEFENDGLEAGRLYGFQVRAHDARSWPYSKWTYIRAA